MQISITMIAAAALCVAAFLANAEESEPPARFEFVALDTNGDMYVDPQEFDDFTERLRDAMRARFGGGREGPADRMLQLYGSADADGDGMLNETEFDVLKEKMDSMRYHMRHRLRERSN